MSSVRNDSTPSKRKQNTLHNSSSLRSTIQSFGNSTLTEISQIALKLRDTRQYVILYRVHSLLNILYRNSVVVSSRTPSWKPSRSTTPRLASWKTPDWRPRYWWVAPWYPCHCDCCSKFHSTFIHNVLNPLSGWACLQDVCYRWLHSLCPPLQCWLQGPVYCAVSRSHFQWPQGEAMELNFHFTPLLLCMDQEGGGHLLWCSRGTVWTYHTPSLWSSLSTSQWVIDNGQSLQQHLIPYAHLLISLTCV